jgi:glycosyltransferase involved in cell wall biosynthesis
LGYIDVPGGKIRVLALIEATSVSGPAKNLIGFARRARPRVELSVAAFRRASAPDQGLLPALAEARIPVKLIDEAGMGDPRVVARLLALLRAEQPDIIQTHSPKSHFLLRLTSAARRAPWIAFHHGFTNRDWKDRFYNRLDKWAMRGADRVVVVCDAFRSDLRAAGVAERRISLRHNFVLPFIAPADWEVEALRARLGIPPGATVMLAVGRLSREKGHADLLEALALLKSPEPVPDFRLVIVGEGPERANLERQRRALGLDGVVLLPGQQADVRPFYGLAGLVVLPSHSEGSPNVLLEAMSAGLPTVATNAGGIVEIAADGQTAVIVRKRDPRALAGGIRRLWSDHELARRLGAQAKVAAAQFTPEAYVESMIGMYRSALAGGIP